MDPLEEAAIELEWGAAKVPSLFDPLPYDVMPWSLDLDEEDDEEILAIYDTEPGAFVMLSDLLLRREHRKDLLARVTEGKHWSLGERIEHHMDRAPGNFTVADWKRVVEAFSSRCAYCGKAGTERTLCIEHVVPVAQGGKTNRGNIVPACRRCNSAKGGARPEQWLDPVGLKAFEDRCRAAGWVRK